MNDGNNCLQEVQEILTGKGDGKTEIPVAESKTDSNRTEPKPETAKTDASKSEAPKPFATPAKPAVSFPLTFITARVYHFLNSKFWINMLSNLYSMLFFFKLLRMFGTCSSIKISIKFVTLIRKCRMLLPIMNLRSESALR